MSNVIGLITLAVILCVVAGAFYSAFRAGKSVAREDTAKAETKAAKAEAQKWADRPRTPGDAAKLLRLRAAFKRKAKL